ncbi:von Willebrand factor type A domain protein [Clostridium perfringens]|uniref:vWA domain-containing protein n=1 Tax=Clostridium perfringens TaxID=1502 RepID=UPI001A249304|nr:VWA domain-containing protein [Clostridium perfringens]EJT5919250.1 VWA domain-containing protein [Clostridium perfringens]EJT6142658.1 VWA domain-containing protein [Clostridium perfringens]MDH5099104.1 von Willebrand factor type A domain protein [Clostridium perfringens]MDK0899104.1 VWA domain-containing protein [Clostridium perfringens]MDM0902208.1 VWA domain-containing protein [Clostridium perfringens]
MKISKKIILILVAMFLSLNFPYKVTKAVNVNKVEGDSKWIQTKSKVDLLKTATDLGNGEYEISLKLKGNKRSIVNPVDIIMVADKSGSMEYEMPILKRAMKNFLDDIEGSFGDYARVSVITFSGVERGSWSRYYGDYVTIGDESDAQKLCDFSSNYSEIKNRINQIDAVGGTNTEAALWLTYKQLQNIPKDHKKYVVFFTDGMPTEILNEYIPYSQYYINKIIIPKTIDYFNRLGFRDKNKVKFYSIGLFSGRKNYYEEYIAKAFISYINNSGAYFITDGSQRLDSVYNDIAMNIINENRIMDDAILTDIVPNNFEIVENAYGQGKTSIATTLNTDNNSKDKKELKIRQPKVTSANSEGKLTWNLGTVNYSGMEVKFKIRLKDKYYGGEDIPTNTKATINFYDPLDSKKTRINEEFNIPKVTIPYQKGTISVSKEIDGNSDSKGKYNNETFTICLNGGDKGKYYLNVSPNGKTSVMKFYIKDMKTDISNNKDLSINYLVAGEYKIEEIDRLNSDLSTIEVNGVKLEKNNYKFTLDKDNKDIKIVIKNKIKNNNGFYDEDKIENSFGVFEG